MIFAAIDIGNTNIKIGIFENDKLKTLNVFGEIDIAEDYLRSVNNLSAAAISSVAPGRTMSITNTMLNELKISPFIIDHKVKLNIKFNYERPETLGTDRICSCEGALSLLQKSGVKFKKNSYLVTSDLGTATTINIVKEGVEFTGGIIAPGLYTMVNSLFENTAQLPKVELKSYKNLIGSSTVKAIESGIINSTLGLYQAVFDHLNKELKARDIYFYMTGGNSKIIAPHLKQKFTLVEELVILGIKTIFDKNK